MAADAMADGAVPVLGSAGQRGRPGLRFRFPADSRRSPPMVTFSAVAPSQLKATLGLPNSASLGIARAVWLGQPDFFFESARKIVRGEMGPGIAIDIFQNGIQPTRDPARSSAPSPFRDRGERKTSPLRTGLAPGRSDLSMCAISRPARCLDRAGVVADQVAGRRP